MQTIGISPKLIADLLTSVAAFLVAYLPLGIDPVLAATIAKLLGSIAAFFAPPAPVTAPDIGPASDDLLNEAETAHKGW